VRGPACCLLHDGSVASSRLTAVRQSRGTGADPIRTEAPPLPFEATAGTAEAFNGNVKDVAAVLWRELLTAPAFVRCQWAMRPATQ